MWGKIKSRFTDDARYWYKLWSSWLAIIWGAIVYAVAEEPSTIQSFLTSIPAPYNKIIPGVAFVFAGVLPIVVRCLRQGSLPTKMEDSNAAGTN
jgi:hypothetical protein